MGAPDAEFMQILEAFEPVARARAVAEGACSECGAPTIERRCQTCAAKRRRIRNALSSARIPRGYDASLDSEQLGARVGNDESIEKVRRWSGRGRLVIVGPAGAGKTMLAVAAMRRRIDVDANVRTALFVSAHGLACASRRTDFGHLSELERDALDVDLLVLDGLGEEERSRRDVVKRTIALREEQGRPTITTTVLTATQLVESYGRTMAERLMLREGISCVVSVQRAAHAKNKGNDRRGDAR